VGGAGGGGAGGGRDIPTHPLVEALAPDPARPPEKATRLYGYPGPSTDPNATRLYLDHELSTYVEVPKEAIRHSQTLDNDAGTILWVDPKASVTHSTTQSQEVQADFLTGGIAQQHLATAAAAGTGLGGLGQGPQVTQFEVSFWGPCITQQLGCGFTRIPNCWVTELCPPSHFVQCPSVRVICTWEPPCAQVTHAPPCPSIGIACTVVQPCGFPTGIACPSQLRCPSGAICGGPVIDPLSPIAR
jgi:hypothetical protein